MNLSAEQILALAPDSASAKAGSQHASLSKWSGLGAHESALWGLCQGSGKDPYRAQIDIAGPAFKCTCPSRKFPCKHALGLYLLYAQNAASFQDANAPQWVSDWLQSRGQRAEKKAAKEATPDVPLTPEEEAAKALGQQKRLDKRNNNVIRGLDVLDTWLADLAREGLSGLKTKPVKAWDAMAARMVDSQASGLATRLRRAGSLIYGGGTASWELAVARELAIVALLSQSYRRLEQLPRGLQFDVKTAVGWSATQEEALAEPGVHDVWEVRGNYTQHEDRISRRASYLRGVESGRWAMFLQFSAGAQPLGSPLTIGSRRQGTLHFYPSAVPLRAVFGSDVQLIEQSATVDNAVAPVSSALVEHLARYAQVLAENPFVDQYPMSLSAVVPHYIAGDSAQWFLRSADGSALPIGDEFQHGWRLHALAGGAPVTVFGLWDGVAFMPLALTVQNQFHTLDLELAA